MNSYNYSHLGFLLFFLFIWKLSTKSSSLITFFDRRPFIWDIVIWYESTCGSKPNLTVTMMKNKIKFQSLFRRMSESRIESLTPLQFKANVSFSEKKLFFFQKDKIIQFFFIVSIYFGKVRYFRLPQFILLIYNLY